MRLLTYNIQHGGHGRIAPLASVINACAPDLVLLQEATDPGNVERLAEATGMADWKAYWRSIARVPQPRAGRLFEVDAAARLAACVHRDRPGGRTGAHLRRAPERGPRRVDRAAPRVRVAGAAARVERHQDGFHVLSGDFNTVAPGEFRHGSNHERAAFGAWLYGARPLREV